ncbi:prepilin peptidase [Neptuniibacter sp. QD37_11]|uniref:prepilin peptidase n=1 Tax=Neptuniibacter sp. QD37_11 TaxID=3398209 RepID=UPI0039F5C776
MIIDLQHLKTYYDLLASLYIVITGLCIGSFINVWIFRGANAKLNLYPSLPKDLTTPSTCPNCGVKIPFYLNVPVLGYIALRGKTACCKQPYSPQYLLLELSVGILYYLCYIMSNNFIELIAGFVFIACLVVYVGQKRLGHHSLNLILITASSAALFTLVRLYY